MKRTVLFMLAAFAVIVNTFGLPVPRMRTEDKIRIREAFRISERYSESIWKGFGEVPFVVLFVDDSLEFLVNHPSPSEDFILSEEDSFLNTKIYYRPRQFPTWFLATFPAVNGINCTVVGRPENTGRSSTDWIITLLHEHFHQYEYSDPDYYPGVQKLDLSGGDESGMWQLNYPFPYENPAVAEQYKKYITALNEAVSGFDRPGFNEAYSAYLKERSGLRELLSPAEYRYFSFQLWQEGIAQYTEYKFLEKMADYVPTEEVSLVKDFIPFSDFKDQFRNSQFEALKTYSLPENKRVCFYANGFAEGLLLDLVKPGWHSDYFREKFDIGGYFL